jgi:dihydrofolate synthase / folylpolyglutamate synthase
MNDETAYQKTLDYLYSFVDYSIQKTYRYSPEKFDLGRMRLLAAALGDPQNAYPVIHIAGTKGKGSVAAFCSSALQAYGHRAGLYTSPHLEDFAERIQVDGEPITHAELADLVEEVKPTIASIPEVTTFEITTAVAFLYFVRRQVDVAVIEVGLGGRLDATNIVDPVVSVITSLSYDHTYLLGETLAEIAGEKAGIIKPGRPVVLAPQPEEASQVVASIAGEKNAPLLRVGEDYLYLPITNSLDGQSFLVWRAGGQNPAEPRPSNEDNLERNGLQLSIPLLGQHQVENAATAYAALQAANGSGAPVSEKAIIDGFAHVHWPGRFEILRQNPPLLIDSAHNRDSAEKLRQALEDYFPGQEAIMIFGASEDKDTSGMLTELLPNVRLVLTTQSIHPRAISPEDLCEVVRGLGKPAEAFSTVEAALDEALLIAGNDGLIVATGSIFLAAAVRQAWQAAYSEERR